MTASVPHQATAERIVRALLADVVTAHGASIAEVARRLGMSPPVLASWIRGNRQPAAADLLALLLGLGHRPAIVLDEDDRWVGRLHNVAADVSAGRALRGAGWTPPAAGGSR